MNQPLNTLAPWGALPLVALCCFYAEIKILR